MTERQFALVNSYIALLTFCAIMAGLPIVALFLRETTKLQIFRIATVLFLLGVSLFSC